MKYIQDSGEIKKKLKKSNCHHWLRLLLIYLTDVINAYEIAYLHLSIFFYYYYYSD